MNENTGWKLEFKWTKRTVYRDRLMGMIEKKNLSNPSKKR